MAHKRVVQGGGVAIIKVKRTKDDTSRASILAALEKVCLHEKERGRERARARERERKHAHRPVPVYMRAGVHCDASIDARYTSACVSACVSSVNPERT